jgi:hypothetical protein
MNNASLYNDAVERLATQSDSIGRLAQDSGGFAAVVAAFESQDPQAFRWVLDRLGFLPQCELICEWVRIKLCVLHCVEICGPLREEAETPSLEQFARVVVSLASDEKLLRRVVDAVSCGDGTDYRAAISELELEDFCHPLCYWICSIVYDRVCEEVCRPEPLPVADPVSEIRAAATVMAALIANEKALAAIDRAAAAQNCETLQSAIGEAGITSGCGIVCRIICILRCAWVCRELCEVRPPILTGKYAIEEARNFALAVRQLAAQPRALADLVSAVQARDAKAYSAIVSRFGLGPYCLQLCAWVCSVTCTAFCTCVCVGSSDVAPLFTKVGVYSVEPAPNDFNPNGTTISGSLAFTGTIPLNGLIPDGAAPQQLKYRFTYQDYSGITPNPNPVVPITAPMIAPTIIGQLEYQFWNGTTWELASADYWVNQTNPALTTVTIAQEFGPALAVSVDTDPDSSGWIDLPTGLNNTSAGANGLFVPTGALVNLDTTKLTSESFDLTGATPPLPALAAGATVPRGALSARPLFRINFEAQTVIGSTPVGSNSLNAIALSNTAYAYVRHPEWPGSPAQTIGIGDGSTTSFAGTLAAPVSPGTVQVTAGAVIGKDNSAGAISGVGISSGSINYTTGAISVTFTAAPASGVPVNVDYPPASTNQVMVLSVDVLELKSAGGCTELDDTIHALYTAYHPYLGTCEVFLQGPGVSTMTVPPGGTLSLAVQPNQGQVIGAGNGSTTVFTGTLTTPVLPGSVLLNIGAVTASDNGAGAISGAGISGSINYATGAISVTYSTAPATGVAVLVDYDTNVSSGASGTPFDMTGLSPCAYILWLQATLNLTSGDGALYGTFSDWIAFCTN